MTAGTTMETPLPVSVSSGSPRSSGDHRGSFIPNFSMISTRFMELRRRRGLMAALILVNIGIPSIFLIIRLLSHAFAPKTYGPAGGYDIYTNMVAGVMYTFGFIVAATLGCTAGSIDLTEGVFRHLVVTGRSRLSLYLARIPAGLAIVVPLVAIGFTIVCSVCVFAAPTKLSFDGANNIPVGLSRAGLDTWASEHATEVVCDFNYNGPIALNLPCFGPPPGQGGPSVQGGTIVTKSGRVINIPAHPTHAQIAAQAVKIANQDYPDYKRTFLYPSNSLMIKSGLWLELQATIGFIVGLGLASLMGQRTVPVILLIILELVITMALIQNVISHIINLQRGIVGVAMAHIEPGGLPLPFGGGGGGGGGPGGIRQVIPESITASVCVVIGWLVFWTAIGAWRMVKRDA